MSIPDPFDVEPVHITIHDKPPPSHDEIIKRIHNQYPPRLALLELTAEKLGAAKARISTLEALTDQLAEALRAAHDPNCWCMSKGINPRPSVIDDDFFRCDEYVRNHVALRAYEADKEAHR